VKIHHGVTEGTEKKGMGDGEAGRWVGCMRAKKKVFSRNRKRGLVV
jgi:hypothetical protein